MKWRTGANMLPQVVFFKIKPLKPIALARFDCSILFRLLNEGFNIGQLRNHDCQMFAGPVRFVTVWSQIKQIFTST